MKILFIGGTGIISSACADLAVARGHELYILNRGTSTKYPLPEGATLLKGDVTDPVALGEALTRFRPDAIYHLAARTFVPDGQEDRAGFLETNLMGTVRLLAAGLACLVHALLPFLFVKTGSRAIVELHERMVAKRHRHAPSALAHPAR